MNLSTAGGNNIPPTDSAADASLVARMIAGDMEAFADLYDAWGDRVHSVCGRVLDGRRHEAADAAQDTFIIALEKIHQLRDPSRVGPWLLAIARHEAIRRGKRLAKERTVDMTEPTNAVAASPEAMTTDDISDISDIDNTAVLAVARDAVSSLNRREAALVELHLVQGLEGRDLAAAAGISHSHLHVHVKRMKARLSDAVSSLYVARQGADDCGELASIVVGWDGNFSSVLRKRVSRHIRSCETCDSRARRTNPVAAAALLPLLPAPAGASIRQRLISSLGEGADAQTPTSGAGRFRIDGDGFPTARRRGRPWLLAGCLALVIILAGGAVLWPDGDGDRSNVASAEASGYDSSPTSASDYDENVTVKPPTSRPPTSRLNNSDTEDGLIAAPPDSPPPASKPSTSDTSIPALSSSTTTAAPKSTPPTSTDPTTTTTQPNSAPGMSSLNYDSSVSVPCASEDSVLDFAFDATDETTMSATVRLYDSYGHSLSGSIYSTGSGFSGHVGPIPAGFFGGGGPSPAVVDASLEIVLSDTDGLWLKRTSPVDIRVVCVH